MMLIKPTHAAVGTLGPIQWMGNLEVFWAGHNQFCGTLTPVVGLERLESLCLPNNHLEGDVAELAALPRLRNLDLRDNLIFGNLERLLNVNDLVVRVDDCARFDGAMGEIFGLHLHPFRLQLQHRLHLCRGAIERIKI